jgi:hypothetical protein
MAILLFTALWGLLWFLTTYLMFKFDDIGATYWSLGIFSYPFVAAVYFYARTKLYKNGIFKVTLGFDVILALLSIMILYPVSLYLALNLIKILDIFI